MADVTALDKHSCAACGAQAEWHPARQALICTHCGTEAPVELDRETGKIREIPLAQALRDLPEDQRGWGADRRSVRCRSCHAVSVFDPGRVGQRCQFCGSPELVDYEEIRAPVRPESVLPFRVNGADVRRAIRRWFASKWLAPRKLRSKATIDAVRGVYLPYWTFDAHATCDWTAESGTYYYTTSESRDRNGKRRTRQVRHVRWRPSAGRVEHTFDDEPVPGTSGVDVGLLRRVEPFPTADLVPYDTAYLSGFVVEHYRVVLIDAARQARQSMDSQLRSMCAAGVPGDTHRNLAVEARFSGRTFKHALVPVWLLAYRYGSRKFQVVVNGYTERIAGRYPRSPWKIAGLVLFGAALLALIVWNA